MEISWEVSKKLVDRNDFEEIKLAHLLINNEIFINNGWWMKEEGIQWPTDYITLHVNCNDVFAWGCADSEDITHGEINELYNMWRKDPIYGVAVWCIKKRKQMPQAPVEKEIRSMGIWNLEDLLIC